MKSQAIFKSIEKLSESRILDIYLRVLKKEERTTGALETSAGVPLMAMKGKYYVILIQKEKRKKGKAQGKAQDSKQKKKKEKGGKKNTLQDSNPRPQSRRSEFFCASHH